MSDEHPTELFLNAPKGVAQTFGKALLYPGLKLGERIGKLAYDNWDTLRLAQWNPKYLPDGSVLPHLYHIYKHIKVNAPKPTMTDTYIGSSSGQGSEDGYPPAPTKAPRRPRKRARNSATARRIEFTDADERRSDPMQWAARRVRRTRRRRGMIGRRNARVRRVIRRAYNRARNHNSQFNQALRRSFAYPRNHRVWRRWRHPSTFPQWRR